MNKGESIPGANYFPSHLPAYSTPEGHPVMIQQVVGAAEMGVVNRKIGRDGPEVPKHAPGDHTQAMNHHQWVVKQGLGLT